MQECQAICLADEECGVATFYDASWECALRRIPGATPISRLRQGAHSFAKCEGQRAFACLLQEQIVIATVRH